MMAVNKDLADVIRDLPQHTDPASVVCRCLKLMRPVSVSSSKSNSLIMYMAKSKCLNLQGVSKLSELQVSEFEILLTELEEVALPLILLLFERIKFSQRGKDFEENDIDYLRTLSILAETCEFGTDKNENIRNQFVLKGEFDSNFLQLLESDQIDNNREVLSSNKYLVDRERKSSEVESGIYSSPGEMRHKQEVGERQNTAGDLKLDRHQIPKSRDVDTLISGLSFYCQRRNRFTADKGRRERTKKMKENGKKCKTSNLSARNRAENDSRENEIMDNGGGEMDIDDNVSVRRKRNSSKDEVSEKEIVESKVCSAYKFESDGLSTRSKRRDSVVCGEMSRDYVLRHSNSQDSHCANKDDKPFSLPKYQEPFNSEECLQISKHELFSEPLSPIPDQRPNRRQCQKIFTCSECNEEIKGKRLFNKHMSRHKLHCQICGRNFPTLSKYNKHKSRHKLHKCPTCSKSFDTQTILRTHQYIHDSARQKRYICDLCQNGYYRLFELERHQKSHTRGTWKGHKPLVRSFPTQYITDVKNYNCETSVQQISIVKPKRKRKLQEYTCLKCNEKCVGKLMHKRHMRTHLHCDTCNRTLKSAYDFKVHMDRHLGNKSHQCSQCPRAFAREADLRTHMEIHNPDRKRDNICEVCGKGFFRVFELERHRFLHSDEKPWKCDICERSFATSAHLKMHTFSHSGIRPYTCEKCGKNFSLRSTLNSHLKLHLGIKNFVCSVCGMKFLRNCHMQAHFKTHGKEKSYSCNICGAFLSTRFSLRRHMSIHKTNSSIKRHMKDHRNLTQVWDVRREDFKGLSGNGIGSDVIKGNPVSITEQSSQNVNQREDSLSDYAYITIHSNV